MPLSHGFRLGVYEVVSLLGAGGMGEVYKARDTKLDRPVAVKLLAPGLAGGPEGLARLTYEARAVSALNHPYIVVIHDLGEYEGQPYIVSEYIEGETLRRRLDRGAIPVRQTLDIAIQLCSAAAAAHASGLVHRDIKPENVMLRPDGFVKLLDFGIAKFLRTIPDAATLVLSSTMTHSVLGTPRYMSPEQTRGLDVDAHTDVWSLGVVLYEMLTGHPPFDGATPADIIAAVLGSDPAPIEQYLQDASAVSLIVGRALARRADERFASAHEMQEALVAARSEVDGHAARRSAQAIKPIHLIVLPFRMLRPDPETDFLAFSLPEALSASLAKIESLVVRSNISAVTPGAEVDLHAIAERYGVDMVLAGTILSVAKRLRISIQLVEAASGTLVWSHAADVTLDDLFELHHSLIAGVVESLALSLTHRERQQLQHDRSASPVAYEYYLRANQLSLDPGNWTVARDLYLKSAEEDALFAPTWAQLARVYRLLANYQRDPSGDSLRKAEEALGRALQLNPNLPSAHRLHAQLEVDRGYAEEAMVRLIVRAREHGGDAELFAALVQTCRVCGLMDASIAAHRRGRELDPLIDTGVMHTYWLLHRYEDALAAGQLRAYVVPACLVELGRTDEARALIAELERSGNRVAGLAAAVLAFLDGRHDDGVRALLSQASGSRRSDPEMLLYVGRHLAHVGENESGLSFVQQAVEGGHCCYPVLAEDPWLDGLRAVPAFQALLNAARQRWQHASAMFDAAGGPAVLESDGRDPPFA